MYDLIYTKNSNDYKEIWKTIKNEYPNSEIEDCSDYIHTNRFSVEFEIEQDNWFSFIIQNGFALCSLIFQLILRKEPNRINKLISKYKVDEK